MLVCSSHGVFRFVYFWLPAWEGLEKDVVPGGDTGTEKQSDGDEV